MKFTDFIVEMDNTPPSQPEKVAKPMSTNQMELNPDNNLRKQNNPIKQYTPIQNDYSRAPLQNRDSRGKDLYSGDTEDALRENEMHLFHNRDLNKAMEDARNNPKIQAIKDGTEEGIIKQRDKDKDSVTGVDQVKIAGEDFPQPDEDIDLDVLRGYAGPMYTHVNQYLRGQPLTDEKKQPLSEEESAKRIEHAKPFIAHLTNLMNDKDAPVGATFYRGTNTREYAKDLKVGDVIRDPAFASVSENQTAAEAFATDKVKNVIRLRIAGKLKAHKINPDTESYLAHAGEEAETLLEPNHRMIFKGYGEDGIADFDVYHGAESRYDDVMMTEERVAINEQPQKSANYSRQFLERISDGGHFEKVTDIVKAPTPKKFAAFASQLDHDD